MTAGKSEQMILKKLQHLSCKQRKQERLPAANQQWAAGGVASTPPAGNATPPTPSQSVAAPPTTTPVPSPVQQNNPQRLLNMLKPVPAAPAVSHNAPVQMDRPRTIPNILSRSKNPLTAPPSSLLTTVEGITEVLIDY